MWCNYKVKYSKWLFGSDLAKTFKDVREASSISSSLRNNSYKAYSNNKTPAIGQTRTSPPTNAHRRIFYGEANKNPSRKGKSLGTEARQTAQSNRRFKTTTNFSK